MAPLHVEAVVFELFASQEYSYLVKLDHMNERRVLGLEL